jgi:hypothetical protein
MKRRAIPENKKKDLEAEQKRAASPILVLSEDPALDLPLDEEMTTAIKNLTSIIQKKQTTTITQKDKEIASLSKELMELKEELHVKECLLKEAEKTKDMYFRLNKHLKDRVELLEMRTNPSSGDVPCAQPLEPLSVDPDIMESRMKFDYVPGKRKKEEAPPPPKKKTKKSIEDDGFFGSTTDDDLFVDELVLLPSSAKKKE